VAGQEHAMLVADAVHAVAEGEPRRILGRAGTAPP
jgi:hypothetical protein